jgi:hypothetical protein
MHRCWLVVALVSGLVSPLNAQRVAIDSVSVGDSAVRHVIKLRDGSTLIGLVASVTADSIRLRMVQGEMNLARSGITEVRQVPASAMRNGEYWFENPHSTRLLFSSTAFPLEKGSGYYSNAWLFMHAFAIGLTDRFTLGGGGTTIPGISLSDNLFYLLPKYTILRSERTNVALGALMGFFPFNSDANDEVTSAGLLYLVGTTGNRESNVSVGLAWGYADDDITDRPGFMVGGQGRISRRFSLISENWFIPIGGQTEGVLSYGLRFLGENLSVDLAWLSVLGSGDISVPWLGFAYRF